MNQSISINQKEYLSVKSAATQSGYSRDHITRLAKSKKIKAVQINRRWFVQVDSVDGYMQTQALEAQVRQQQLRAARKQELSVYGAISGAAADRGALSFRSNVAALVVCALLLMITSFTFNELISFPSSDHSVATVQVSETQEGILSASQADQILVPRFTEDMNFVSVDSQRYVNRPDITNDWKTVTP